MSQAVCEIHLITICLLSVTRNYLCSSSPLWRGTDFCKPTEFLTDNSSSTERRNSKLSFLPGEEENLGHWILFSEILLEIQFSMPQKTISSHTFLIVCTLNKYLSEFFFFLSLSLLLPSQLEWIPQIKINTSPNFREVLRSYEGLTFALAGQITKLIFLLFSVTCNLTSAGFNKIITPFSDSYSGFTAALESIVYL